MSDNYNDFHHYINDNLYEFYNVVLIAVSEDPPLPMSLPDTEEVPDQLCFEFQSSRVLVGRPAAADDGTAETDGGTAVYDDQHEKVDDDKLLPKFLHFIQWGKAFWCLTGISPGYLKFILPLVEHTPCPTLFS